MSASSARGQAFALMTASARRALGLAVSAGADGLEDDATYRRHVRRLLGELFAFASHRDIAGECRRRTSISHNGAEALAFATLREAAMRRINPCA